MSGLAFLDCETISLLAAHDVIWEVGVITRDDGQPDQEWLFQLRPNMGRAVDKALEISRFAERYQLGKGEQAMAWPPPALGLGIPGARLTHARAATALHRLLDGRHVIGAVPNFDTERLGLFMRRHFDGGYADPWHYHLVDVENLAVGYLAARRPVFPGSLVADFDPSPPWDSDALTKALGLDPVPDAERHTALGDCRWARSIYDLVMGGVAA